MKEFYITSVISMQQIQDAIAKYGKDKEKVVIFLENEYFYDLWRDLDALRAYQQDKINVKLNKDILQFDAFDITKITVIKHSGKNIINIYNNSGTHFETIELIKG